MGLLGLYLLPLTVFILFPLVFAASYFTALKHGHINAFFAYISDTGTNSPEMCIFGLGLSLAMLFVGAVSYVRYKQVGEFLRTKAGSGGQGLTKILNKIGLFFGLLAAFGTTVVGAFQETSVLGIHILGAFMAFGGGSIFLIIQGILTLRMTPTFSSKSLGWLRVFLGTSCLILFVVCISAGMASFKHFTGEDSLRWEAHEGGWTLRVISTVSEWIMAALFDLYFLTFVMEFKRISFVPPQFNLVEVSTVKGRGNNGTSVVMHYPVSNSSGADQYN